MPRNEEILAVLNDQTLDEIERLAQAEFAPSDIAVKLRINKAAFMRIWRDENSDIWKAYQRGCLEIRRIKMDALQGEIEDGNVTAIQTHEKMQYASDFEAWKQRIFSIE